MCDQIQMQGRTEMSYENSTPDVVLSIVATDANKGATCSNNASTSQEGIAIKSSNKGIQRAGNELPELSIAQMSHETKKISPPPKIPNELVRRRPALTRSYLSKCKSRLVEPPYPPIETLNTPLSNTPKVRVIPVTHGEDEDEDEDVYKSIKLEVKQKSGKKLKFFALVEWIVFISSVGLLIASLTIRHPKATSLWSLALWKWCVVVVVIFCGRLITEWLINIVIFLVERNFLLKKKVLYFIYGLKRGVQVFLWFGFIFLAWVLLFSHEIKKRSRKSTKLLHHVTMALAGCLVGAGIWLLKTILIKTIALSFHVKRFFDRIQESLFHQYVLQTLSGPPLMKMVESNSRNRGHLTFEHMSLRRGVKEEVIDVEKLHRIKQDKVSAWTMKGLIDVIRRTKLSTISDTLDCDKDDEWGTQNKEITSEWEAKAAADKIFSNVAKPGYKFIEEEDFLRFMKTDELNHVFPLFEGANETGKIKKSAVKKWVVNAYLERKSLAHSLNDTKTAVKELNNIASVVVLIAIVIVWNLMMGFLTTKLIVFISSQLLLVAFMFGDTVKTVFEAIIFVFVMHPFDVGDRCVIDGVQMIVEEMNILTTVFLRYDNEKIIYPNTILATKPISNFYRSPEMSDSVEFTIDFNTTVETIATLKERIKGYIESKPQHWRPSHSLQLQGIEDLDKTNIGLYVTHTINFQNGGERACRRSDLVLELKKILDDLKIRYRLLPQEVHVTYVGSPSSTSVARA